MTFPAEISLEQFIGILQVVFDIHQLFTIFFK